MKKDQDKTKAELSREVAELRQRVTELEGSEEGRYRTLAGRKIQILNEEDAYTEDDEWGDLNPNERVLKQEAANKEQTMS